MNIIYETTKERGTTILIPTSMVDSMNPVSALGLAAQRAPGEGVLSLKSAAWRMLRRFARVAPVAWLTEAARRLDCGPDAGRRWVWAR
jgi:hypothetical protein